MYKHAFITEKYIIHSLSCFIVTNKCRRVYLSTGYLSQTHTITYYTLTIMDVPG